MPVCKKRQRAFNTRTRNATPLPGDLSVPNRPNRRCIAMLTDMTSWLERVSGLPEEVMELEMSDEMYERMADLGNAAVGFEEGSQAHAKNLHVR